MFEVVDSHGNVLATFELWHAAARFQSEFEFRTRTPATIRPAV